MGNDDFDDLLNDPNSFGDLRSSSDPLGGGFDDPEMGGFGGIQPNDDLPPDLPPTERSGPNRTFLIGIAVLAVIIVVAIVAIVFSAINQSIITTNQDATINAVKATNNAILTQIAATATAKSWTLTPSSTPIPTNTPSATPSNTPAPTATPVSPTATITDTLPPGITPSVTSPPSFTPASNSDILSTLSAQNAQLQSAQTLIAAQETLNAVGNPSTIKRTQNAEFRAAQTAIAGRLTVNAVTLTSAASSGGAVSGGDNGTNGTATPSPTLGGTPLTGGAAAASPTQAGTSGTVQAGSGSAVTGTPGATSQTGPLGERSAYVVMAVKGYAAQALATPTPVESVVAPPTDVPAAANPTADFLNTETAQLYLAQTALAQQVTLNALANPGTLPAPVLTENGQVALGQTAIAIQLTANAAPFATNIAKTPIPKTGLYEDLAAGRAGPASLALAGLAALALIAVIAAARRLRARMPS